MRMIKQTLYLLILTLILTSCSSVPKSKVAIPGFESQTPRGKSKTQTKGIDLGIEDAADNIEEVASKQRRKSKKRQNEREASASLEEILLLEIQASRGEAIPETIEGMITYAESNNNEEVAQRAYELSTLVYDPSVSKDVAQRWSALASSSDLAQQSYILQLLIDSDYKLAFEIMAKRVDLGKSADFRSIARSYQVIDESQTENLITTYNRYSKIYPDQRSNLNAGSMLARYKLAHFLFYQERYVKALSLINLILANPTQIKGLNLLQQVTEMKTRIYYLTNHPTAEPFYKKSARKFPRSYPINVYYALHLLRENKNRQSEEFLINWAKKNLTEKEEIHKLFTLGVGAYKVSFNNLYKYVLSILEKHPNEEQATFIKGAMAFEIRDVSNAESLLSRVDNTSPLWLNSLTLRLKNAIYAEDFTAAEDLLEETLRYDRQIYLYLIDKYATDLIHQGLTKRVRKFIADMPKQLNDETDVLEALGFIYYKMGDISAMSKSFDKALRKDPDNHSIRNSFGYSLADKNVQLNKARKLINAAIEENPTSIAYVDSLGWLSYRRGKLQEAKYLIEWAYRRKIDPEIAAHLGEVLWHSGQKQRARYLWLLNSELYPSARVLNDTIDRYGIDSNFLRVDSHFFNDSSME